jgi:AcrR family transcriptional regulator
MEYNEKQQAIITIAEKLFSVNGFDGTSVRDIAHEAGVNVAMISYYFGSKEKLMEAVFEQKTNVMRLKVENLLLNTELSSLDKLYTLIDDYVNKFMNQQQFQKIMLLEQLVDKNGGVPQLIYELKKRNIVSIEKLIQEGQNNGQFIEDIDIPLMMNTMVGTVSQMIISQRFYKDINKLQHLGESEYTQYMINKLSSHLKRLFKVILTNEA